MKAKLIVRPREELSRVQSFLFILLSILGGFAAIGVLFAFRGINPFNAFVRIISGSFGSAYGIQATISKAIPLILIGTGLCVAFQGKFWNIGAEGQLLAGAAASTWIALKLGEGSPALVIIPAMLLAAFVAGAIWGMFPAILKLRFGINDVISTLMLNYVAQEIIKYLVVGPWKGETKFGYPYTNDIPSSAQLALLGTSRIHMFTLVLALVLAVVLYFLLFRSRFGYEVRVIGENQEAARYAGINFWKTIVIMMAISGGMAGLAGFGEIAGIHHHLTYPDIVSGGYGFTAIIVAWLGKRNPLLAIISGIFFAGIVVGGDAIQISFGLPAATVQIFNGMILAFLIMGDYLQRNKLRISFQGA